MQDEPREFSWTNTNKLLGKGFNGVKTGVTPAAGPCLAASFEKDSLHLVVVVMNTKTMDNRWVEVPKLTLWAINRLNKMCEYFAENQLPNGALRAPPQQAAPTNANQNNGAASNNNNESAAAGGGAAKA